MPDSPGGASTATNMGGAFSTVIQGNFAKASDTKRTVRFSSESTEAFKKISSAYTVVRNLGEGEGKTRLIKEKATGKVEKGGGEGR